MNDKYAIAKDVLLKPAGITEHHLDDLFNIIMSRSVDFSDIYFQSSQQESWVLEDGIVKDGNFSIDCGVGIRAVIGDKTGFAYSDDLNLASLQKAANAAAGIAKQGGGIQDLKNWRHSPTSNLYPAINPLGTLSEVDKIAVLQNIDTLTRQQDPRVSQVMASLSGLYEVVLIVDNDGKLCTDVRPLVRINVTVIVEHNGRREQGFAGGGGRYGYEHIIQNDFPRKFAAEAVRQALINLEAISAPAGAMPVVLGSGWPGVLLHEAIGHGLEGDFNRKGSSVFSNRIGERVATELCTVVDDGTLPGRRGSLAVDDEGTPSNCTVLIENGILKSYMQDKLNAKLMRMPLTGNGRRESYSSLPIPRMTNTYMLAGKSDPQEIISSVEKGLYAVNFGGGQVDITSGKFVFSTSEAYLIEKGKVTTPVKGATLIGNGPDVLTRVSMVGNDLNLDDGVGVCGKDGQSIPVGVGQPTLRVDSLTIGGTHE